MRTPEGHPLNADRIKTLVLVAERHLDDPFPLSAMSISILMQADLGTLTSRIAHQYLQTLRQGLKTDGQNSRSKPSLPRTLPLVECATPLCFKADFGYEEY